MIQLVKVLHFLILNGGTTNHLLVYFMVMWPPNLHGVNKVASITRRWSEAEVLQVHMWACICFCRHVPLLDTTPRQTRHWRKWKVFGLGAAVTLLPVPMTELQFPRELSKETLPARCALIPPTVSVRTVWFLLWTSNSYHAVILTAAHLRWKNAG